MENLLEKMLNLVYPPRCEVCRCDSHEPLCAACFKQIKFMRPYLGVSSVSIYDGVIKTAIHRFKFDKRKNLAEPLGILLVKYLSHTPSLNVAEIDAIIPVPLHAKRHRQRGFNQVELVARIISRYFGINVFNALERIRDTKSQFDLPREERLRNVSGAFRVADSKAVFNKRVILMDDIYTTGATIAECSKVLKTAGAKKVEVLTISRAI